jgi:CubicO group peptidase (beta-lactamase class C family)
MRFNPWRIGATALLASLSLVGCGTSGSEDDPLHEPPRLTEAQATHLDSLVTKFAVQEKYPNLAIGVVMGGELVWQHGVGKGPTPGAAPDADTSFRVGPSTIVATTTALLTLVEAGEVSLDDEAATWLPEASGALTFPGLGPVTVRHLLNQTSGIPHEGNGSLTWHSAQANVTQADLFSALEGVRPSFEPGTDYEFSYLGISLAGLIIERASGMSFRDYVQQSVLQPLRMNASTWDPPATGLATGHNMSRSPTYEPVSDHWRYGSVEPSAGLYSTVSDLARLAANALGHRSLLQPATLEECMSSPIKGGGTKQEFGLGWRISEDQLLGKVAWQFGTTEGYSSYLALAPAHDLAVVVLLGSSLYGDAVEAVNVGQAVLSYLVDETTDVLPEKSKTSPEVIDLVGQRLLALVNEPTPEKVVETFEPSVVESLKEEAIVDMFQRFGEITGTCAAFDVIEDFGEGTVAYMLACANGRARVLMHTLPNFPHHAYGFVPY